MQLAPKAFSVNAALTTKNHDLSSTTFHHNTKHRETRIVTIAFCLQINYNGWLSSSSLCTLPMSSFQNMDQVFQDQLNAFSQRLLIWDTNTVVVSLKGMKLWGNRAFSCKMRMLERPDFHVWCSHQGESTWLSHAVFSQIGNENWTVFKLTACYICLCDFCIMEMYIYLPLGMNVWCVWEEVLGQTGNLEPIAQLRMHGAFSVVLSTALVTACRMSVQCLWTLVWDSQEQAESTHSAKTTTCGESNFVATGANTFLFCSVYIQWQTKQKYSLSSVSKLQLWSQRSCAHRSFSTSSLHDNSQSPSQTEREKERERGNQYLSEQSRDRDPTLFRNLRLQTANSWNTFSRFTFGDTQPTNPQGFLFAGLFLDWQKLWSCKSLQCFANLCPADTNT